MLSNQKKVKLSALQAKFLRLGQVGNEPYDHARAFGHIVEDMNDQELARYAAKKAIPAIEKWVAALEELEDEIASVIET